MDAHIRRRGTWCPKKAHWTAGTARCAPELREVSLPTFCFWKTRAHEKRQVTVKSILQQSLSVGMKSYRCRASHESESEREGEREGGKEGGGGGGQRESKSTRI